MLVGTCSGAATVEDRQVGPQEIKQQQHVTSNSTFGLIPTVTERGTWGPLTQGGKCFLLHSSSPGFMGYN